MNHLMAAFILGVSLVSGGHEPVKNEDSFSFGGYTFDDAKAFFLENIEQMAPFKIKRATPQAKASFDQLEIEAGKAFYTGKSFRLEDGVTLKMGDGKLLTCTSADFDPETDILLLHGSIPHKISYHDGDVSLSCMEARMEIKSGLQVDHLEASGDVRIIYQDEITAIGDNAEYLGGKEGYLKLLGKTSCSLETAKGDKVVAQIIQFHRADQIIGVKKPTGVLATKPFVTNFKADSLLWNRRNEEFEFYGDVEIKQNKLGTIAASESLMINKKEKKLHGEGEIELSFFLANTLKCRGSLDIDHVDHTATIHSPVEPIIFKDTRGEIQSHRATVHYLGDDKPLFVRFLAQEDVRITSFATVQEVVSDTPLHTIVTDQAELNVGTQSLTLSADKGKRTLLYDHVNHLQVSAPSLVLQRDLITHKDKIEGLGDVRFSFTEQELKRLKEQLSWIK